MSSPTNGSPELDGFLNISFLDLEKIDEDIFRSKTLWKHRLARGVYGGQMIGHSLVAASHGIPETQHIHSLHSYFLKNGNTDIPLLYHVDKTRDGKTYHTRSIKACQAGNVVFTMQASFKSYELTVKTHQLPMPKVPQPDELKSPVEILDMLINKELISAEQHKLGLEWYEDFPIDIRWVDPFKFMMIEPQYPKRSLWFRARGHIGENLHPNVHKCCLAYMSDLFVLQTALMPHSPTWGKPIFMTSLDHSMWFHSPCHADNWMLYEIETDSSNDGRALCLGRIWDINGTLVTTVAQEGVMRISESKSKL